MRSLYTLILHLYALFVKIVSLFNRKARLMCTGQGYTNDILRKKTDRYAKYIWFHAASLGEFEQGRPVIEAIRNRHPRYKILLTFFSPSGYEVCKSYKGADIICYLPFDTPSNVRAFLNLANPAIAFFIKYEFWLNYLTELKKRGIHTYLISAVFRPEQLFFKWYGKWYRKALKCYDCLFVQDEASKKLLHKYRVTNVEISGDTRFDRVLEIQKQARLLPQIETFSKDNKLILVAGSTWPEDEKMIISYFNKTPEIKLILAPHEIHSEHLKFIESISNRSAICLSEFNQQALQTHDCLIIDRFGLLSSIYRYAHIAYIGGGFGKGIHNTLEAAVYGMPVVFGPEYHKFKEAKKLITFGGGFSIDNEKAFFNLMNDFIENSPLRIAAGQAADRFVHENSGATDRILSSISNAVSSHISMSVG